MSKGQPSAQHLPAVSADGVDLTLIRWMLTLTPRERIEVLQTAVNSLVKLRELSS